MTERRTAEGQLTRVLEILPRATREGGAALSELAAELGATDREILRDLEEVYTRAYYHPAGGGDDVEVLIEGERVEVWTRGEFRRPQRLTPREGFVLGLGLRVLAAESAARARPDLLELANRLETLLASGFKMATEPEIAVGMGSSPEGVRTLLADAGRDRRQCQISYLKPGSPEAELRTVDPYVLLAGAGKWYLIGFCHRSEAVRVFRADRVVQVTMLEERFDVPEDFDPYSYVTEGRVYRADEFVEVIVRYSPRIARWIQEHGPAEAQEDGSVLVQYRMSDPHWLLSHVLQYGADAEVLEPPEMRVRVREVLARQLR